LGRSFQAVAPLFGCLEGTPIQLVSKLYLLR